MKKTTLAFLLFSLAFLTKLSSQELLKEVSLENQIQSSTMVVEGKVIAKKSFWDENYHNIYTRNTIEVYKIFKGEKSSTIEIITSGGIVGNEAEIVSPSLKLNREDIGLFMLYSNDVPLTSDAKSSNKEFKAYSSLQGFYKYNLNDNLVVNPFIKKKDIANSFYSEVMSFTKSDFTNVSDFNSNYIKPNSIEGKGFLPPSSITFNPTTSTAGTASVLTISGSGFGATQGTGTVSFSNADDGGATFVDVLNSQILTWSDTEITVEIPTEAGTGPIRVTNDDTTIGVSTGDLTITYSQQNAVFDPGTGDEAYQTRHIDRDGSGGYIWQMYTDFDSNSPAKAAFLRAFETWRCETGVNWTNGAVTTTDVIANDDINIIRFDNGSELPNGTLGRCTSRWSGCGGVTIEWYVEELDIVFDDATNWNFSTDAPAFSEFDFESVAVHELGHGHQLGHVIETNNDVMHFSITNSENLRILSANNIAGANDVQSRSIGSSVCGESVMTNYSGSCNLSIDESELANAISIYPNPATTEFFIKNESFINLSKAIIYDVSGRQISEYDLSEASRIKNINVQGLSGGVYIINIHSDNAKISKKLMLD